ncbi:MAG TPA: PTS sugar transporter subunit IIA [Burkholderiaceae bacterium]|nr:PTS sugar transporter subunit IIA [Burkholderiaceae bacterium]
MIGIVLIAHQPLGKAFAEAASHVFGDIPCLAVLDVLPEATLQLVVARAEQLVEDVDQGYGVLVLTDLFGATPANIAAALAEPRVKVLAGLNLPMLLRAIGYRQEALAVVAEKAAAGGTLGIVNIGFKAPQRQTVVPDSSNREAQRAFQQQQQQQ